jgi:hypothetical protein
MVSESSKWYATPIEALSQGDIVRFSPYGVVEAPLIICQPQDNGKARYYEHGKNRPKCSKEFAHASFNASCGIVVWPDCQIDKGKNQNKPQKKWFSAIAPVIPISALDPSLHEKIQSLNRAQYFPLPAFEGALPESYVDLRYIWPVRYSLLSDRITTLSQTARKAFLFHRFWFDTSVQLEDEIKCPHCQTALNPASLFHYKEPE